MRAATVFPVSKGSAAHLAFGRAVRDHRRRRNLSQEELGFRSGLHRTYVSGIERGRRNPTLDSILKLAEALGVAPGVLVDRALAGRERDPE